MSNPKKINNLKKSSPKQVKEMQEKKTETRGRNKIPINYKLAEELGKLHMNYEDCANLLSYDEEHKIAVSTLYQREDFIEAYEKGKSYGNKKLSENQMKLSETSASMAIWLGKQYLGQKEMPDSETSQNVTIILKPKQLAKSDDDQD